MLTRKSSIWWILIILLILILLILWWLSQRGDDTGPVSGKTVFVTSDTYTGNLGGLGGADALCQGLATEAGVSGTFKVWISGREQSNQDAAGRLSHAAVPYKLVDGTKVADDWADLVDGSLDHAINITETGASVSDGARVWTNTTTAGLAWDNTRDCALGSGPATWTCDPSTECPFESGKFGLAHATDGSWTGQEASNIACSNTYHLYCLEQ
ncbi:MAG: hypothetical protein ACE5G0_15135 [Rhodothermales bacterium]